MAEQQMMLFVEDMATGETRQSVALPLTDELMETLFPEPDCDEMEEPMGVIQEVIAKAQAYGEKMGVLAYHESKMTESAMDSAIIGFVDGVHSVHRLDPEEREQVRNAAFVAAYQAAQRKPLPTAS